MIDKAKAEILRIANDFHQLQNKQQATGTSGFADDGELKHLYESVILTDFDWSNFTSLFDKVYPEFFIRLKQKFPQLSLSEKKFIALFITPLRLHFKVSHFCHGNNLVSC